MAADDNSFLPLDFLLLRRCSIPHRRGSVLHRRSSKLLRRCVNYVSSRVTVSFWRYWTFEVYANVLLFTFTFPVCFDSLCFLDCQMCYGSVLLLAEVDALEWASFFPEMTDRGECTEVGSLYESEVVWIHAIIVEHEYVLVLPDALPTVWGFVPTFLVVII